MKAQTLYYEQEPYQLTKLEDTNTFLVHASSLEHGELYVPTLFVEGIKDERLKFDFYKAYKNNEEVILHCEYRSTNDEIYKLIVHTQYYATK